MTTHKETKTYRRQLSRRINTQSRQYLWTLTPAAKAFFEADGLDVKWARRGYAMRLAELAEELLTIERELD